jgi:RecJ-like exonuclease
MGPIEPAFRLSAQAFREECKTDLKSADAKFQGKVIELSGRVDRVTPSAVDGPTVFLQVEGDLIGVPCLSFEDRPWVQVVAGQTIKIKGLWPIESRLPTLVGCVVTDAGQYAAVRVAASALARELAADGDATIKKYADKQVAVTGRAAAIQFKSGEATVEFATDHRVKVVCKLDRNLLRLAKQIEPGQTLEVVGEFFSFQGETDILLINCLPLAGF